MPLKDSLILIRQDIACLRIEMNRIVDTLLPLYKHRMDEQTDAITALQDQVLNLSDKEHPNP